MPRDPGRPAGATVPHDELTPLFAELVPAANAAARTLNPELRVTAADARAAFRALPDGPIAIEDLAQLIALHTQLRVAKTQVRGHSRRLKRSEQQAAHARRLLARERLAPIAAVDAHPAVAPRAREHRPVARRRAGASSSTSSSDPGDPDPAGEGPPSRRRRRGRSVHVSHAVATLLFDLGIGVQQ